ncbi:MAG: O-antigen ligase domain-containing protein [Actinobacteria bacterium]|nr:O-antigen ligase domain-containing protein [Actinomycetota bacterium]
MAIAVSAFNPRRAQVRRRSAAARERWARIRVGTVWALLVLNVLTFYGVTWDNQKLLLPIPSALGKLVAQGALPLALLMAMTVNRRLVIRPNVFLGLILLLVVEAALTMLRHEYVAETLFGTIFRTSRLAGFAATLWLLTPWWGRRDLLLVRCHLTALGVILGSVVLGLLVAPSHALEGGRLAGALWPIPPTQVAHYDAVTLGLVALLWLSGRLSGKIALAVVVPAVAMLFMTHTRTALFAMVLGLVVGGLSLFAARSRVRKAFLTVGLVVVVGGLTLAGVVTHWLVRGQDAQQLSALTGRTTVWSLVLNYPRTWFETAFGFGLSNNSFNGLPIDSNWLATYHDQGLAGIVLCAAMVLFLLITAYFQPRGAPRALALFLVVYCLVASFTETGLSQPSDYLLEMALAASLLVTPLAGRRPAVQRPWRDQPVTLRPMLTDTRPPLAERHSG